MKISFFEEFPTKKNLKKINLIDFPTKLYVAAKNLEEFCKIKKQIKNKQVKQVIYWPVLNDKFGYWLSPWSDFQILRRTLQEIKNVDVLWDAELPPKRWQMITKLPHFFINKRNIQKFFKHHEKEIYVAEYMVTDEFLRSVMDYFCLNFDPKKYNNKIVKMIYSSMHDFGETIIKHEMDRGVKMYGEKFLVALGTTAIGKLGNEPKITLKLLRRDLKIAKSCNVNEVIIFRLGGLNKKYLNVLKENILNCFIQCFSSSWRKKVNY